MVLETIYEETDEDLYSTDSFSNENSLEEIKLLGKILTNTTDCVTTILETIELSKGKLTNVDHHISNLEFLHKMMNSKMINILTILKSTN